ncbi:hypothetical protein POTOM_040562 [Populus tomentosa]|uniref:B box-type domain-containing protein n=1 Tax=Populus tomentosa TaxID=118781 RepID=A0A8X7YKY6_POPTO|nr:hypothetical protein POTOM_040562 [Populus tomentosa]
MKRCELCDSLAKVYCESDQANLCWDCDANVHSANFLVAKHSRSLLFPWSSTPPPPVSSPSNDSEECSSRFCHSDGGISKSRRAFSSKHRRGTVP